jgi:N-acetylneuraminate synthase
MKKFNIGKILIDQSSKPLIIPEIGINHFGSLRLAKKIVDEIAKSGAKIIKTQTHIPDLEMSLESKIIKPGNSNKSIYEVIKKNSLSLKHELELKEYIESKNLEYLSTPFCIEAAEYLNSINVKAFKIGSGEFNHHPLIEKICSFKKPIILSSGMHTRKTIIETVKLLKKNNANFIINYCVNLYPTPLNLINLNELSFIKSITPNKLIGYSDHTSSLSASLCSLFFGVSLIEKHFSLNKNKSGPDISCSMNANELTFLINSSNEIFDILKVKKSNIRSQEVTRKFAFHALVANKNMVKNYKILKEDISIKRPSPMKGSFAANEIANVIGKRVNRVIKKNRQLKRIDIF